jgi:hypothetical protein
MTREEADFIGAMNMCDEISNEAYKKIMCHCEVQEPCADAISRKAVDVLVDELARKISDERLRIPRGRSAGEIMQDILDLPSVTPKQKQEPILDKIRAEIEQTDFDFGDFYDHTDTIIQIVLEIIDKYRAESEEQE